MRFLLFLVCIGLIKALLPVPVLKQVTCGSCFIGEANNGDLTIIYSPRSRSSSLNVVTPSPVAQRASGDLSPTTAARIPISFGNTPPTISPRIQRIRDIIVQKEILRDVTAAEFALVVDSSRTNAGSSDIDYDMLTGNLQRKQDLLENRIRNELNSLTDDDIEASDEALLDRVIRTKVQLEDFMRSKRYLDKLQLQAQADPDITTTTIINNDININTSVDRKSEESKESGDGNDNILSSSTSTSSSMTTSSVDVSEDSGNRSNIAEREAEIRGEEIKKEIEDIKESLRVVVREDGSVDWDGALSAGRQVSKLTTELWERLNGKEHDEGGTFQITDILNPSAVKQSAIETDDVSRKRKIVNTAQEEVNVLKTDRDILKLKLRTARKDNLPIDAADIAELRNLDTKVKELSKRLRLYILDLDMERICVYLRKELEGSIEPTDQKLFVAEAALLEKQLQGLLFLANQGQYVDVDDTSTNNNKNDNGLQISAAVTTLIDEDELTVVDNDITDLKYRLGIESNALSVDWGSLGVVIQDTLSKVKLGISFYGEGTRMLVSDLQYAWTLLGKATLGRTLKPREVNTVRRTGKDLLTLIPFTIILLIPLSPVGHVLVFSFIQRFFPEFYPSCYTEKRLNLRKLYSEIERKKDELGDILDEDEEEKRNARWSPFSNFGKFAMQSSATGTTGETTTASIKSPIDSLRNLVKRINNKE